MKKILFLAFILGLYVLPNGLSAQNPTSPNASTGTSVETPKPAKPAQAKPKSKGKSQTARTNGQKGEHGGQHKGDKHVNADGTPANTWTDKNGVVHTRKANKNGEAGKAKKEHKEDEDMDENEHKGEKHTEGEKHQGEKHAEGQKHEGGKSKGNSPKRKPAVDQAAPQNAPKN